MRTLLMVQAPKKSKKDANSINSKLNLVMKSGKESTSFNLVGLRSNLHEGYSRIEKYYESYALWESETRFNCGEHSVFKKKRA